MSKTTSRQRRARSLASFLAVPYADGKFGDYYGNPAHAPKRWKRLWARQDRYVAAFIEKMRRADQRASQSKETSQ